MNRRKNETDAAYKARRAAYDHGRFLARTQDRGKGKPTLLKQRTVDGNGKVKSEIYVLPGKNGEDVPHVPDPSKLARISTLYGADGEVRAQWIIEKPEDDQRLFLWREAAKEFARELPRVVAKPMSPNRATAEGSGLLACYPVGDHHLGMLAWKYETGASYDIDIGEDLLNRAMLHLIQTTPPCENGLIVFLGDFMHYDSFVPQTPTSGNPLDADGRAPKMVRAAIRAMRRMVNAALTRHDHVHVIIEIGNHDPFSAIFLQECLRVAYENEPRVAIDTSPRHYHYYQFGSCLIASHHGHGAKPDQLPGIMAADEPVAWGLTQHRFWLTGHIHKQTFYDFPGCSVESFRILPPQDAWAMNEGYRSKRGMTAILYHAQHGEVARSYVTPAMLA